MGALDMLTAGKLDIHLALGIAKRFLAGDLDPSRKCLRLDL